VSSLNHLVVEVAVGEDVGWHERLLHVCSATIYDETIIVKYNGENYTSKLFECRQSFVIYFIKNLRYRLQFWSTCSMTVYDILVIPTIGENKNHHLKVTEIIQCTIWTILIWLRYIFYREVQWNNEICCSPL